MVCQADALQSVARYSVCPNRELLFSVTVLIFEVDNLWAGGMIYICVSMYIYMRICSNVCASLYFEPSIRTIEPDSLPSRRPHSIEALFSTLDVFFAFSPLPSYGQRRSSCNRIILQSPTPHQHGPFLVFLAGSQRGGGKSGEFRSSQRCVYKADRG